MTRPLPTPRVSEGTAPRSAALDALLDVLNPRLLDMLVPEGHHDDGRAYFSAQRRLAFRRGEDAEYEVLVTGDGGYLVTVESGGGLREVLVTDSLRALELFILVDDLLEEDREQLIAWLADRRGSSDRGDRFEHRWGDGATLRGDRSVHHLPELVDEFEGKGLVDVMEVVEQLRRSR